MSARHLVIAGALVAVAGAILLYRATRGAGDAPPAPSAADRAEPDRPTTAADPVEAPPRPTITPDRPRPSLPDELAPLTPESDTQPRIWTTGPTPEGEEMPLEDRASAMRRLGNARDAYRDEDWPRALAVAESVLQVMPTRGSAREIAAMAACRMRDVARAQDHADQLERGRFQRARNVCLDEDIHLLDPYANDPVDAGF